MPRNESSETEPRTPEPQLRMEGDTTMARKPAPAGAVNSPTDANATRPDPTEIAARAFELWLGRGCPIGSPEVDWFPAEEQLGSIRTASTEAVRAMASANGT